MLTAGQIAQFKRDGVLLLRGFIPPAQLDDWRRTFWQAINADPDGELHLMILMGPAAGAAQIARLGPTVFGLTESI